MRKLTIRETTEAQREALLRLPALTHQNTESKAIWTAIGRYEHMQDEILALKREVRKYKDLAKLAAEALDETARAERLRKAALDDLFTEGILKTY